MTEKLTLQQRLIKAQTELRAPKNQRNTFAGFNYRSAEDILEAVKPVNAANNLLLTIYDEPIMLGDRVYIKATAEVSCDVSDESIKVTAYAREPLNKPKMDESQVTGSASSYARKYALNGLYLIDDTKDADTDEHQKQTQQGQSQQARKASDKQLGLVQSLVKKHPENEQKNVFNTMLEQLNLSRVMTEWTSQQASAAIKYLQGN